MAVDFVIESSYALEVFLGYGGIKPDWYPG